MSAKISVQLRVNGVTRQAEVEPRQLLVHLLRDTLGLTGTHIGCDTSQCGACSVLLDGEVVKSCAILAVQADEAEIVTIEGLGSVEKLHPIQQGLWEKHGLQCGFCTPGVMMAMVDLLQENSNPTEEEIREGLAGVICRCTGYQFIISAVQHAAELMRANGLEQVAVSEPLKEGN